MEVAEEAEARGINPGLTKLVKISVPTGFSKARKFHCLFLFTRTRKVLFCNLNFRHLFRHSEGLGFHEIGLIETQRK